MTAQTTVAVLVLCGAVFVAPVHAQSPATQIAVSSMNLLNVAAQANPEPAIPAAQAGQPAQRFVIMVDPGGDFFRVGPGGGRPVRSIEIALEARRNPGVDPTRLELPDRPAAVTVDLIDFVYIDDLGGRHSYRTTQAAYRRPHENIFRPVYMVDIQSYRKPETAPYGFMATVYHPPVAPDPRPQGVRQLDVGDERAWIGRLPAPAAARPQAPPPADPMP